MPKLQDIFCTLGTLTPCNALLGHLIFIETLQGGDGASDLLGGIHNANRQYETVSKTTGELRPHPGDSQVVLEGVVHDLTDEEERLIHGVVEGVA